MENGVCCDEPTLLVTLQVELFFNVLVVVSLRPENRGSRRAITLCQCQAKFHSLLLLEERRREMVHADLE